MTYSIDSETHLAEKLYVLRDPASGAVAKIWPALGANCVQLALPGPDGDLVTIIDDENNLEALRLQPSRYGNPILYPWASRITRGEYWFRGIKYQSQDLHTDGDAWHGLVRTRNWKVTDSHADDSGASLTCLISTETRPDILQSFPFPNSLAITFRLTSEALTVSAEVRNLGTSDMPFGFGFHPYFNVPLGPQGSRADCLLEVHAAKLWNWAGLSAVNPSQESAAPDTELTADNPFPVQSALGTRDFNEGFTQLETQDGKVEARVIDPASNLAVVMQAFPDVKSLVVYTPPGRNAICLEPWTCTANTFSLAEAGIADSGLLILEPGRTWHSEMRISLSTAQSLH